MLLLLVSLTWLLLVSGNPDSRLKVFHRIYLRGDKDPQWTVRGYIEGQNWISEESSKADLAQFTSEEQSNRRYGLYQIALERYGDKSSLDWDVSSVPVVCSSFHLLSTSLTKRVFTQCHLHSAQDEHIVIHTSQEVPYGLSYSITPVPASGGCEGSISNTHPNATTSVTFKQPSKPSM
jgi:hypothetical protein